MAENVNIVGFPSSVLKDALKEVPPWATEKTAKQMEILLSRSVKVQEETAKKLVDAVKDSITKGTNVNLEPLHDYLDELENASEQLKKNQEEEEKRNKKLEKNLKDNKDRQDRAADAIIAGLVKFSSTVRSTLSTNIDSFTKLDQAGVGLSSGFGEIDSGFKAIGYISKNTGVSISELSNTLSQYSTAINMAGMAKFSKLVGESSKTLNQFGYSNKQAAELLGAYLETERLRGEDGSRSQLSMRRQLEQFGKTVRELGKTSGIARDEILSNLKAQSASTDSFVNSIKLGADAGKNIDLFVASLKDQDLARKISELMTTDFKTINSTYMDLVKTGNGALASSFANVLESMKGLDPAEQKRTLMEWAAANEAALDQAALQAQRMKNVGVEGAAESLATIRSIKTELKSYRELSDEERAADEKAAEASSALASEYQRLKAQLTILITPITSLVKGLTIAVSVVNSAIDAVSGFLNIFGDNTTSIVLQAAGALGGLAAAGFALVKVVGFVSGALGLFRAGLLKSIVSRVVSTAGGIAAGSATGIAGALGEVVAGSAGVPQRKGGPVGTVPESTTQKKVGIDKASGITKMLTSVGTGVGNIVASLGAGAGKLIESVMTGIAGGIKAFGNPAVLKGALIFSGVLAIVSAGVRLSSFILGDSLPKIAEGFEAFNKIDGLNLLEVGLGISSIAVGLMAFTASEFISNAGSILTGMTKGFMGLLGIEGPMDRLKSFADMGPALESAGKGLSSITSSINLLSSSIASMPESGRLKSLINDINNLSLVRVAALGALLSIGVQPAISQTPTVPGAAVSAPAVVRQPVRSAIQIQEKISKDKVESAKDLKEEASKQAASTAQRTETVDINNMINQQNVTLLRLLDNAENQLSVNREMLQYIRNQ